MSEQSNGKRSSDTSGHGVATANGSAPEPTNAPGNKSERGEWGSPIEFIFTCIGYAVGLGNVWRFPYLTFVNGGGAFLIPFTIMLVLIGIPLFFMELAIGQYASLGPISVWKLSPLFKGLGFCSVFVSMGISMSYNVVIAYSLFFLFASVTDEVPWDNCDNVWNTDHCVVSGANSTQALPSALQADHSALTTPSEEYFYRHVLQLSTGIDDTGGLDWRLALCVITAWAIVLLSLIKGIQSMGKVVYFTAIFPYVMLTVLLVRSAMLEGAMDGIIYYLQPQWDRLLEARVWSDAAVQMFYSLSACSGGLIAMSSFNKFKNNCYRDSLLVPIITWMTCLYAGFLVFAVLGFMAFEKGTTVDQVAEEGPGLVFVVYPEALARMPVAPLWSVFFFIMLATLGFGSQFSMTETVLSSFLDEFAPYLKPRALYFRIGYVLVVCLLCLPMVSNSGFYLLNLIDQSIGGYPLLIVGLFECIGLQWVYGFDKFADNIHEMLGFRPGIYWKICWKYVSPVVLLTVIIFRAAQYTDITLGDYEYPGWALSLGWLITAFPVLWIPTYFFYKYCKPDGFKLLLDKFRPRYDWGPEHSQPDVPAQRLIKTDSDASLSSYSSQNTQVSVVQENVM